MNLFSDATAGDRPQRDIQAERRRSQQARTARTAERTSVGAEGMRFHSGGSATFEDGGGIDVAGGGRVLVRDDGYIEARYSNGESGLVFGTVQQAGHPDVPHGTGLYVWAEDGTPIWWTTQASDGRTELVTGTSDIPIQRIWHRVDDERHYAYDRFLVQTFDGAEAQILADGNLWLFSDADVDVFAGGDLDLETDGAAQLHGDTQAQVTSSGPAAIAGQAGSYILREDTGLAANMYMDTDGRVYRSTSSIRYKTDIQDLPVDPAAVLQLRPRSWLPRPAAPRCPDWLHTQHPEGPCPADQEPPPPDPDARRISGFIAEELVEIGLGDFVEYDAEGRPDAIHYDRLTAALVPLLQRQQAQITELTDRVAALESSS